MLDLSVGAFAYVLHGMQENCQPQPNLGRIVLPEAVLIVALLYAGLGLYALHRLRLRSDMCSPLDERQLCFRVLPELQLGLRHFDRSYLQLFYRYGGIVQLAGFLCDLSAFDREGHRRSVHEHQRDWHL